MMRLNRSLGFVASVQQLIAAAPIALASLALTQVAFAQQQAVQQVAAQQVNAPGQQQPPANAQPFPQLTQEEFTRLQKILAAWETQSKGTNTLECDFQVWHYDAFAAPPGVHATKGDGSIRYAAPDKGMFRVDRKVFFNGMQADPAKPTDQPKPTYIEQPGQFGDYWICNGKELIENDRSKKEWRIQQLPPEMQGTQIFNSPLPFVFNLDAKQIQERYWVREIKSPDAEVIVLEAWPKRQVDRAQYKVVQIALSINTFAPRALLLFAPNFDPKVAPNWDHYQFDNAKRNTIGAGLQMFVRSFIDEKPPTDFKVLRDLYQPPADEQNPQNMAEAPAGTIQK
jgi:TIGR03009 family protein